MRGDLATLADYRAAAPAAALAHPTVEHLVPMFVTLGAATDPQARVETAIESMVWGNLTATAAPGVSRQRLRRFLDQRNRLVRSVYS